MNASTPPEDSMSDTAVAAELSIRRALVSYARGIDRCDADLLRSAYHDDAYDDHGDAFRGSASDFVEWVIPHLRSRFLSTMHTLHNVFINLDGETADVETYCIAHHVANSGLDELQMSVFACRYVDRFENRPGRGWRITHRTTVREWQANQPMLEVAAQSPGFVLGSRDGNDPSYVSI
ncbi:nuclear transport factor 2 family protein [Rhodococcus jostii]|uniref:nuclear transport factor 2 family protein n=1 Tax=Rhodococcus jostii TaxID=132919 RepID=UPI003658C43B